jgi:hypothetical protein
MKCNTQSSTETELISLCDKLPDIVWTRYFVECQGYDIDECVVFQDNMSALSLEKNGRISSSKWTKHIKEKYFLIKDYYEYGEIDLRYCPTDIMWADVLTKPLQGQKFRDMRAFLQNCPRDYNDDIELQNNPLAQQTMNHQVITNVSYRECVGEHSHSKARHISQSPVKTTQNVPVHFVSKVKHVSWSPVENSQNVPVHFGSKVRHPVETAQNVPVDFNKPPQRQTHVPCKRLTNSRVLAK